MKIKITFQNLEIFYFYLQEIIKLLKESRGMKQLKFFWKSQSKKKKKITSYLIYNNRTNFIKWYH
jgi:hypothetical protein